MVAPARRPPDPLEVAAPARRARALIYERCDFGPGSDSSSANTSGKHNEPVLKPPVPAGLPQYLWTAYMVPGMVFRSVKPGTVARRSA